jgi:hydrogenase nickel incorporation protein HypB
MEIKVMKSILDANDNLAVEVRAVLKEKNVRMFNLIGSPGAGKTTIMERTLEKLKGDFRIAIIEGDCATDKDAQRLKKYDVPIVMINTENGCYIPSVTIKRALGEINLSETDIVFIENIGNLVCPAHFDLGENAKVAVASVTEGDDKPAKYPLLFSQAEAVLLNKIDLAEYTNFNKEVFYKELKVINPEAEIIELSGTKNAGFEKWISWIKKKMC